jgi:hypothetical protein
MMMFNTDKCESRRWLGISSLMNGNPDSDNVNVMAVMPTQEMPTSSTSELRFLI